jgi:predicted  nucleic acid-binding Zn-ribbon protein
MDERDMIDIEDALNRIETERDALQMEVNKLDEELLMARAKKAETGRRSPPVWYAQTQARVKALRLEIQVLNRQAGSLRAQLRDARGTLEKFFMQEAMEKLPVDLFYNLMEGANERYVQAHGMPT